jgi:hypothetical protein
MKPKRIREGVEEGEAWGRGRLTDVLCGMRDEGRWAEVEMILRGQGPGGSQGPDMGW